ncbi:Efflux pump FUS6 [Pseudocercospora fuligena]|uniref:Efflux pump FUS6 n=1 Tax=Pseudocercospora fuligena TaxID=685502 RepID=A0A8H6RAK2_9PEZI|nr:Efflux pump FUS6 [Pseudocercospora fuligena]
MEGNAGNQFGSTDHELEVISLHGDAAERLSENASSTTKPGSASRSALAAKASDFSMTSGEISLNPKYNGAESKEAIVAEIETPIAADPKEVPTWRFVALSLALGCGLFMSFMDGSITSTALYTIGVEFESSTKVTWIALAYTLADVGLAIVFTTVANIIGRFEAYLAAQTIFVAFSFAAGFAKTLDQLIAFRTFQGIGGSGLYTLALVIWQEVSSRKTRKWVGASIGLCVAAGGVMGPILGGIITGSTTWRWIFWINPPIALISTTLFIVSFPHGRGRLPKGDVRAIRKFDVVGCVLLIAGCVLPVFSLMHAAEQPGTWNDAIFIGPIVAGIVSWIALIAWEMYIGRKHGDKLDAVFPTHLFRNRRYAANAANSLLMGVGFSIAIYDVPLRLQTVNGKSPMQAGLSLLPLLCLSAIGSTLGTILSPKRDNLCPTIAVGSALMALGTGLLATLSNGQAVEAKLYGFQVFVGLGFGMTASSSSLINNIESKPKDHAVAQGVVAAARVFGGSVGLAGGTAILGQKVLTQLRGVVDTDQMSHLTSVMKNMSPTELAAIRHTYSDAFNETFIMAAAISAAAVIAGVCTWNDSKEDFLDRLAHKGQMQPEVKPQTDS